MGIENRDYLRGDGRSPFGPSYGSGLVAVKWIIIVNIAVMVLQLLTLREGPLGFSSSLVTDALALGPGSLIERFQIWRLVTYAFCHSTDSMWHIFFNMLILYFVGRRLEPLYGTREFLWFYMTAIVVSGLAYVLLELVLARPGTAIGASGAVAASFIVYALKYPHERWYFYFVIPIEVRWLCIAYVVFDIFPVLRELGGGGPIDNVAHACHLGGYLFGYLYYAKNWHLDSTFRGLRMPKMPRRQKRSHLKVYAPQRESAELEAKMDEILEKISLHGESSLTDEERSVLSEASRKFRNRSHS